MLRDFRAFILRGNVVDLAVGVVIGVAFAGVIGSFVANILTPLITIPGKVDFSALTVQVGGGTFRYGRFLNDLLSFVLIAAAVFFAVVRPMAALQARRKATTVEPASKQCPYCLSTIPDAATRCAFCASDQ